MKFSVSYMIFVGILLLFIQILLTEGNKITSVIQSFNQSNETDTNKISVKQDYDTVKTSSGKNKPHGPVESFLTKVKNNISAWFTKNDSTKRSDDLQGK